MEQANQEQEVRIYYDRNTRKFFRLLSKSTPKTIHQPLFATDKMSLAEALHTQHKLILEILLSNTTYRRVLDLGCGVGESLLYLAKHTPDSYSFQGITLSPDQARIATKSIDENHLAHRITVIEASYQSLPTKIRMIDLAYAIESYIHSTHVPGLLAQTAAALNPHARFILIDDFLMKKPVSGREMKILKDFRKGWLANAQFTVDEISSLAKEHGFVLESYSDLSPMLRLHRPRDWFIALLAPLAHALLPYSQYARFLVGGNARQAAYRNKLLQYAMLVFVRQ